MVSPDEKIHLFLLCTPFTGSTLLHDIIATSERVTCLPTEGQHLEEVVDEMRGEEGHHWNPSRTFDWEKIRAVWASYWEDDKPIRLEKSPPNLLRAEAIEEAFPNAYFVVMIGNPYAFCEGCARRDNGLDTTASAELWRRCAEKQIENVERLERVHCLTYEYLTERTETAVEGIRAFVPGLTGMEIGRTETFSTLGRNQRRIWNINALKILKLSNRQIEAVNEVLDGSEDVLSRFGYRRLTPSIRHNLHRSYVTALTAVNRIARRLHDQGLVGAPVTDWLEERVIQISKRREVQYAPTF